MASGDLSILEVIEKVTSGKIRIPAFQRGFVWDADNVAYLMDSIYKGYPFGAVILWRTREQLRSDRQLGPFPLQESDPDYPLDYVLDGQQRLTSIFGVFQTQIEPVGDISWANIYYDYAAAQDLQDSQFLALSPEKVDLSRHFPIGAFFDVPGYRKATKDFNDELADRIGNVQAAFQRAAIPVQLVETNDRAKVAIVFERVNKRGMDLDVLQLLSAWTWSEDFDLQNKFTELSEELRPFGFHGVGEDSNLLLRCCSAVVEEDVSSKTLINLNGAKVRDQFPEIVNGLKGAIDFLKNNMNIETLDNMPYNALLVPLTAFFAAQDGQGVPVSSAQRRSLLSWFWRSCFSRRFSAGVIRNLNRDILEILKLRKGQHSVLSNISATVTPEFFKEQAFSINAVDTKVFILLLAHLRPLSFVSGSPIRLSAALQAYNRNEFHHLYPRAFLKSLEYSTPEINALANFTFMSSLDNKKLGGVAPSVYRERMDTKELPRILERAACLSSLFDDDYDRFLDDRSQKLADLAEKLMGPK